ncbi:MAG: hypothetical protein ACUVX1_09450 [Chloroflexota bacterium]
MRELTINRSALRNELELLVQTETLLTAVYDRLLPYVRQEDWQLTIRQFKEETQRHLGTTLRLLGKRRTNAGRANGALPIQLLQGGYEDPVGELRGLQELMAHTFLGQGIWLALRAAASAAGDQNLETVADGVLREKNGQVVWYESTVREVGLWAMTRRLP